ncbi:MAG: YggT family protein [Acidimicrobiales bacterium]|jgi:YggT family protein|nr:YggT family protein [Acidimicrobiales bacterium]MDP6760039.1 YggT family protein [Acidimicrobiales bacterium]|tara:strand:+ start:1712 stop:1966 length:255 start_codon:yes stop_codon:yes gene_type:complete
MGIVCLVLTLYFWILLLRVISSWFPISPHGTAASFVGFLLLVTDPVLVPLRRILPPVRLGNVGLDLSPLVAFFGLIFLQRLVCY